VQVTKTLTPKFSHHRFRSHTCIANLKFSDREFVNDKHKLINKIKYDPRTNLKQTSSS
jgi:hypothetical protein